jgi:hypothetical protein
MLVPDVPCWPTNIAMLSHDCRLGNVYREQYKAMKDFVQQQPQNSSSSVGNGGQGKATELDENNTLGKFELFSKRCKKLVGMFHTISQVSLSGG